MSTFLGERQTQTLKSEEDLYGYFQSFAKPKEAVRVGIEVELFAVNRQTGKALPYEGPVSIHAVLKTLVRQYDYEPILENDKIIALKCGTMLITLEPGGQVELSAPPALNVFDVEDQIQSFLTRLRAVRDRLPGMEWIAFGIQPFSSLDEITWVPKERYTIMANHFRDRGTLSHFMMKSTATNQVNFDYLDEKDALAKLRVVLGLTSIVSALFANSSFSDGKPNGFMTKRLDIWNHTDPDRAGLIVDFTEHGKTFSDYLRYLCRMPMMFMVRHSQWIPVRGMNFYDFIRHGYEGEKATLADFELHLSTAFPEARFKQYLEIRGVDCQRPELIPAVAAFWKGLLYDPEAREKAWNLIAFASKEERVRLHREVPRQGLRSQLGGKPILPIARELVELSCASLAKQKTRDEMRDECQFLSRIRDQITNLGRTPAETLIETWQQKCHRDPARLIEYLSIG